MSEIPNQPTRSPEPMKPAEQAKPRATSLAKIPNTSSLPPSISQTELEVLLQDNPDFAREIEAPNPQTSRPVVLKSTNTPPPPEATATTPSLSQDEIDKLFGV